MRKKVIKSIIIVVLMITVMFIFMFFKMGEDIKNLTYKSVNMENVEDGLFEGNVETMLIKVKVSVEVKEHKLIGVNILEHDNGRGKQAEAIVDKMIEENTDSVDIISGATASSEVIKSAVNQALCKGVIK